MKNGEETNNVEDLEFDNWNIHKKNIEKSESLDSFYFNEKDIWWCSLGKNIGNETDGKGQDFMRPVLVFKKLSADSCIVIPVSTKHKIGTWFENIDTDIGKRCLYLHQIRMINKKRLQRKITAIQDSEYIKVKNKLRTLLNL